MTKDLLSNLKTHQAARDAETAEVKNALWAKYNAILRRSDSPRAADAEELLDLAASLGVDPARIEEDVKMVAEIVEFERQVADEAMAREELGTVGVEREKIAAAQKKLEDQEREAYAKWTQCHHRIQQALGARKQLARLRKGRPGLFTD